MKVFINDDGISLKISIDFSQTKKLVATFTGVQDNARTNFFQLFRIQLNTETSKILYFSTNPNSFVEDINRMSFDFKYIVNIGYFEPTHIQISNYPNDGEYYVPSNSGFESFRIEHTGLVKKT